MMHRRIILILILFPLAVFYGGNLRAQNERIHPYNKVLMRIFPRAFELKWPEVPRILARDALLLYKGSQALFVRVGVEGGIVPGALHGPKMHDVDPSLLAKLAGNRVIIVY
jgi:hypothetical protein